MAHAIDNARFRGELRQAMADFQNKLAELRSQLQGKKENLKRNGGGLHN